MAIFSRYEAQLTAVPSDDFTQTIVAGQRTFDFSFRWDTAIQEQMDILEKGITARRDADPLVYANTKSSYLVHEILGLPLEMQYQSPDTLIFPYTRLVREGDVLRLPARVADATSIVIVRDYDYFDFFLSLPSYIDVYVANPKNPLPQSVLKLDGIEARIAKLKDLIAEAKEIYKVWSAYDKQLYWHCKITDDEAYSHACDVLSGGYVNNQSAQYAIRFLSDLDRVRKDDLMKCVIQLEIVDD